MENIREFLDDIQSGKFKIQDGTRRLHSKNKIVNDIRYKETYDFLNEKYNKIGMGIKSMIKDYSLPITYSVMRNSLVSHFDFELKSSTHANKFLRNKRKENARIQIAEKRGAFDPKVMYNIKTSYSARGVQGYYFNKSMEKYVWLRSSWEYIYAKWLDKNNIKWDSEYRTYNVGNNILYKPDFFVFGNNNKIIKIIEIKGYWKSKKWKFYKLKELVECETVLIEDIEPYTDNFKVDFDEWKIKKLKKI